WPAACENSPINETKVFQLIGRSHLQTPGQHWPSACDRDRHHSDAVDRRKEVGLRSLVRDQRQCTGRQELLRHGAYPPVPNRFPKPGRRQDDPLLSMKQEALPVSSATTSSISPRYLCLAKVTPTILILSSVGVWPVLRENTAPIS